MQVKKFEAPTIQEALDTIKRELGPEAIILQTKKNKRGFGLMSRESVEVTAAVSDRSLQKKGVAESRVPQKEREALHRMPASRQAEFIDKATSRPATASRTASGSATAGRGAQAQTRTAAPAARSTASSGVRTVEAAAAGTGVAAATAPAATRRPPGFRYIDVQDDEVEMQERQLPVSGPRAASGATGRLPSTSGMTVEEELRHLKRMIEEMKAAQDDAGPATGAQALMGATALETPALQDAFDQLVIGGVDKRLAVKLVKNAAFELREGAANPELVLDQLAVEIMRATEVHSALSSVLPKQEGQAPAVIALVGPTGVGKTTTVAKIASDAILHRNLKVGLINLDSYKVAAFDQLATYAKILNVPFRSASTLDDLRLAMQDFQALDLVIVDTTGRSQKDPKSLDEMKEILQAVPGMRTHLVLSATTRDAELYDMTSRFGLFKPEGLIFSKLDEAMSHGALLNVSLRAKLPLLYFTTGQRVPEDIEEASRERVAALILEI